MVEIALLISSNLYKLNNMSQQPNLSVNAPSLSTPRPQPYDAYFSTAFLLVCAENKRLWDQNQSLQVLADRTEQLLGEALNENRRLKSSEAAQKELPKRKYSKRRNWLQKKYVCQLGACHNAYSSKIALNLHIRKRHCQLKLEG